MAWDVLQGQEYEERKPGIRAVLMRMSTSLHCLANRAISASINSLDISLAYPPTPSPDSLISTSKGSAPNDLNCSRAAGLKRKWTNRSIYYISLNHYNTNNIWHLTWCQILGQWLPLIWQHLLLRDQLLHHRWPGPGAETIKQWSRAMQIWKTINKHVKGWKPHVQPHLSWGDFSCSCDLTSEESAKVVGSQNHGFITTKQNTYSNSYWSDTKYIF